MKMNEKCAACIHCEVCGFIESEVAKDGACDFYEDGKRWELTKEEKALLQKWRDNRGVSMKDFEDAMDALEQEPCEDAISRQAVIDALCDGCELFKNGEQTCFTKCEEYHFLATLPPVTPQPKTGHWIYSKAVNTGEIIFSECSVCGHGESRCAKRMNYCPNCGAKMNEPQESEGEC